MAKNSKKSSRRKSTRRKPARRSLWRTLREGRPLSLEFFRNHAWLIFIAVVMVLALIGQRYTNQSKRQQIKALERELATLESEQVSQKAMYMSLIRENEMRRLLRKQHLDLDYQEQPPFILPE